MSYDCTEVWGQLRAETPAEVHGQSSRWGSGATFPEADQVFVFKH